MDTWWALFTAIVCLPTHLPNKNPPFMQLNSSNRCYGSLVKKTGSSKRCLKPFCGAKSRVADLALNQNQTRENQFRSIGTICGGLFPKMYRGQICNLEIRGFWWFLTLRRGSWNFLFWRVGFFQPNKSVKHPIISTSFCFNEFEKYWSKWIISPNRGEMTNICNHHL